MLSDNVGFLAVLHHLTCSGKLYFFLDNFPHSFTQQLQWGSQPRQWPPPQLACLAFWLENGSWGEMASGHRLWGQGSRGCGNQNHKTYLTEYLVSRTRCHHQIMLMNQKETVLTLHTLWHKNPSPDAIALPQEVSFYFGGYFMYSEALIFPKAGSFPLSKCAAVSSCTLAAADLWSGGQGWPIAHWGRACLRTNPFPFLLPQDKAKQFSAQNGPKALLEIILTEIFYFFFWTKKSFWMKNKYLSYQDPGSCLHIQY